MFDTQFQTPASRLFDSAGPDRQAKERTRERARPLIGVLCCNDFADRPVQSVATRFVEPLAKRAGAAVLLVPSLADSFDARSIAQRIDGLLLTGSRSNVAPHRYGESRSAGQLDEQRDEVALALAGQMIEDGKPVFGICRGLQELNVLFGGSLCETDAATHFHPDGEDLPFDHLFEHEHLVELSEGGRLASAVVERRIKVNSVHRQGICRLGSGLSVEAVSTDDALVEAFYARPCGGDVLAVQWHPEWNTSRSPADNHFFSLLGTALREEVRAR